MEVKGSLVSAIKGYVQKNHPEHYNAWLNGLPEETRKLLKEEFFTNEWYGMNIACVIPTESIGDTFFNGNRLKAAWVSGRYSAEAALKGIYWFYVKTGKPQHIIHRATRIFSAYYQPSMLVVDNKSRSGIDVVIQEFEQPSAIVEARIGGWMERALEISGGKDIRIKTISSLTKGARETRYKISWQA